MTNDKKGPGPFFGFFRSAWVCLAAYVGFTVLLTWPLALGVARDVPGDLGDSLLIMWILGWGAEQIPRLLTGATTWAQYWQGNIFQPAPYTLALSEHMFAQVWQILPVYHLTHNLILCYNLLFLSTFILSALGVYLLVRDLTGDARAGFIAGIVFGFLPYRISQIPHLQILSAQWMPFALWGFHRYIARGSTRALAGGTTALVWQNWSCGYYLLYFAPFVPLFVVHQLWMAQRLADRRAWLAFGAAGVVTLALTLPFLLPYLAVQETFGFARPLGEVITFSANVWSYLTAAEPLHLWGRVLRFYPHGEGETFLGVAAAVLAGTALVSAVLTARWGAHKPPTTGWRRVATILLAVFLGAQLLGLLSIVLMGGVTVTLGAGLSIRATTPVRLLTQALVALALLLALSPQLRATTGRLWRSPIMFYGVLLLLAVWLSLGPLPGVGDRRYSGLGLYSLLYDFVPGFTGVRVPARYAMIAGLWLAVLAGFGATILGRRNWGTPVLAALATFAVLESATMPMRVNGTWSENETPPPARVFPADAAPPVYKHVATLPAGSVVAELPFGDPAWEIRYVYYSTVHWKPLVNGYSGAFPPSYAARKARLRTVSDRPDAAWEALLSAGTTHVVVHGPAFINPHEARFVHAWLTTHGAEIVQSFPDGDALYSLPV